MISFIGIVVLSLSLFLFSTVHAVTTQSTYRAAVIDYAVANGSSEQPIQDYVLTNANKMVGLVEKAKTNNADIVIFPELGTMADDNTYFVAVPDPKDKIAPADSSTSAEVLRVISRAARTYKIYVVINVHENSTKSQGETMLYNTNVAFDRNGYVVARYRKYNLFGEDYLNRTHTPEHVYFDTDFGVRFGMFICFDILFEHPATDLVRHYNISHFVYSTAWYSELPFLTSIQAQNAFSFGHDVTVLAAGLNAISRAHTGSGIYRGRYGTSLTYQSHKDGTTLIVGDVPKVAGDPFDYTNDFIDDSDTQFKTYLEFWQENMTDYDTKLISPGFNSFTEKDEVAINDELQLVNRTYNIKDQLCRDNLCCTFDITIRNTYLPLGKQSQTTSTDYRLNGYLYYRMAIANGKRGYAVPGKSGQQICGIISCVNGDDVSSCARQIKGSVIPPYIDDAKLGKLFLNSTIFDSVKITGNFTNTNVLPTVSTLTSGFDFFYSKHLALSDNSPTVTIKSDTVRAVNDTYQAGQLVNASNIKFTTRNNTDHMMVSLEFNANHLVSGGIFVRAFNWDQMDSTTNVAATLHSGGGRGFSRGTAIVLGVLIFPILQFF